MSECYIQIHMNVFSNNFITSHTFIIEYNLFCLTYLNILSLWNIRPCVLSFEGVPDEVPVLGGDLLELQVTTHFFLLYSKRLVVE